LSVSFQNYSTSRKVFQTSAIFWFKLSEEYSGLSKSSLIFLFKRSFTLENLKPIIFSFGTDLDEFLNYVLHPLL